MKTIALVIGISSYKDAAFRQLPGAQVDSERFASALESWGMPADWIFPISQEQATKAEVIKAFCDLRSEFDVEAKFIFYFAGHGVREHAKVGAQLESSLIMHDTRSEDILGTSLRLVELMQLVRALKPVQTFLFIDACRLRLNSLINPLNDTDIFSTSNSKGLFCMFSSGVMPSYEDVEQKSGYFTTALVKAIGELRHNKQPSCHDILKRVENSLLLQNLPTPEAYHVGSSHIWPLESHYAQKSVQAHFENPALVQRKGALRTLEDYFRSAHAPVVWMWGEAGLGKTVIAEQFAKQFPLAIYASLPHSSSLPIVLQSLIEQVSLQKSELFFNRPPESLLSLALRHVHEAQPAALFILDHIDRLKNQELKELLFEIDQVNISSLLISRHICPKRHFGARASALFEWHASSFSEEETQELIETCGLQNSLSQVLVNNTCGNALKTRQLLVKLSGQATPLDGKMSPDSIKCITAIIASGGFLDEQLFCQSFHLKPSSIQTLVQFGLIRYSKEGGFPHDILDDLVEENGWALDLQAACSYWNLQISHTPFNRLACRSLALLASHVEDCRPFKRSLGQCLGTLNEREYVSFLLDLVAIFEKHAWEDLLLQASDYLVDHEEYKRSGEVLASLLGSEQLHTRHQAIKNAIRRLVWIGQYIDAISLYQTVADECQDETLQVAMRNHVAIAYFFLGSLDKALDLFRQNYSLPKVEDERELGITKYMLGLIMTYRNENLGEAKKLIESSILIFESTKFYHWLIVGLNGLADLSYSLQEWKQALGYLSKAHEIAKALQNKTFLLFTLKNIARAHLRLFGPMSQELVATTAMMESLLSEVLTVGHTWATMWAQNVLCTVYAHRGEPHRMTPYVHEVSKLTEHYDECHIFSLSNLGHYSALTDDLEQAAAYYERAYSLCKKVHNPFAKIEIRQDFLHCNLPLHIQEHLCSS